MLLDASISITDNANKLFDCIDSFEKGAFNYAYDMCVHNGHMPNWGDYRFDRMYEYASYKLQCMIQERVDIMTRVLSGDIDPARILYMPIHALLPETSNVWDTETIRKTQTVDVKVTTDYACPQCKARRALQFEVQTKGCDEELLSIFKCQECGNKWTSDD